MFALALVGAIDPQPPQTGLVCNSLRIGDGTEELLGLTMGDAELVNDLADVGALPWRRRRAGRPARGSAQTLPYRRMVPQVPGAPAVGLRLQPLGFPVVIFTATSGTALTTLSRPQRPFKAKRLVVDIARTGATSTGLVTVTQLQIGTNNQFVSTQPIGAAAFAANAFDVNMELAACTTALDVTIGYAISTAPTTTDTVAIATTIFGEAVG